MSTTDTAPRFAIRHLHVLTYAEGFTLWLYKARDVLLDDMTPLGFFNDAGDMFAVGDIIMTVGKDGCRIFNVVETGDHVVVGVVA